MWSDFLSLRRSLAATFWSFWSLSSVYCGSLKVESYSSLTEREQKNKQGCGLVEWGECVYACVLNACGDVLRFKSGITPKILPENANGTSASPMWMADGERLWINILFESTITASVFLSFGWSLAAVIYVTWIRIVYLRVIFVVWINNKYS